MKRQRIVNEKVSLRVIYVCWRWVQQPERFKKTFQVVQVFIPRQPQFIPLFDGETGRSHQFASLIWQFVDQSMDFPLRRSMPGYKAVDDL